jgi:hypothetical protein
MHTIPDVYHIDLRDAAVLPVAQPEARVVNHNTTYNIHGSTIAAVGENATVASSMVIGQATQWTASTATSSPTRSESCSGRSRRRPARTTTRPPSSGPVGEASRAIKSGDHAAESRVIDAVKRFGKAAWAIVESSGLTYLNFYLREKLGLPPPGHTA